MAFLFIVKVTPQATKYRWQIDASGMLKCYVSSPAVEGRANDEFVKKLAKLLKIPASAICIESGATSRFKKVLVYANITHQQFLEAVGLPTDKQLSFLTKK